MGKLPDQNNVGSFTVRALCSAISSMSVASFSSAFELLTRFDTGHFCSTSSSAGFIKATALEGLSEHRRRCDPIGPSIERRELHVLDGLAPPARNDAPPHRHERALLITSDYDIYRCCGTDVEPRLQVGRRCDEAI